MMLRNSLFSCTKTILLNLPSRGLVAVAISFLLMLSSHIGQAAPFDQDIALSADSMERDSSLQQAVLKGNVQIVFGGYHLSADYAKIFFETKEIVAEGQVVLQNEKIYIEGEALSYNYQTERGVIEKGFVKSGQVIFEGSRVEKTGENTFLVNDAQYTACTTCPAAWSFSGSVIEAEIGGYAWIKYPVMKVANFPIFAFFGIVVPLKSTRQSGFLIPGLEDSDTGGTAISESYFWAISRSKDLTVTAKHYSKRGLKGLGEFRYVLDEDSYGHMRGAYIYDRAFIDPSTSREAPFGRGFLAYQHYYLLPNNYIQRADLLFLSDLLYHRDFHQELGTLGSAIENRSSITRNLDNHHFSVEVGVYRNLLKSDYLADNDDAVHRLPEINYSLTHTPIKNSNFLLNFDFNYVNFSRETLTFDDVITTTNTDQPKKVKEPSDGNYDANTDQVFDPDTDLIRSGHRMLMSPTISYPVKIGQEAEVMFQGSYHESQYFFNPKNSDLSKDYSPNASRRHVQADVSIKTRFHKVFGDHDKYRATLYKHVVEPKMSYSTIPWLKAPNHKFFGDFEEQPYSRFDDPVTDEDFFGNSRIQFDYKDRLFNKNLINFEVTNRVLRKQWLGETPTFDNIVTLRLKQSYDINEQKRENPRPWSALNLLLEYKTESIETVTTASYHPYAAATSTDSRVRFKNKRGDYLEFLYSQIFNINEDAEFTFAERNENWGMQVGYISKYFNLATRIDYSPITYTLYKWYYFFQIKPPGDCWGFEFSQEQAFRGANIKKFNFYFQFGGKKTTSGNF